MRSVLESLLYYPIFYHQEAGNGNRAFGSEAVFSAYCTEGENYVRKTETEYCGRRGTGVWNL